MTPARRRELLGDAIIAHIHAEVAAAPPPSQELIDRLRLIFARPAARQPAARTTAA